MHTALAYATVILVWATTPLAIKWSAEGGAPYGSLLLRVALATLLVGGVLLCLRQRPRADRAALWSYLLALPGVTLSMMFSYASAPHLPSGLISVMFGLSPLLSGVLMHLLPGLPRLQGGQWLACLLGFAGLAVVFADALRVDAAMTWPLLGMFMAVLLFVGSAIAVQRRGAGLPPLQQTFGTLLLSVPLLLVAWGLSPEPASIPLTPRGTWAVLYLAVIGSLVGLLCYYFVLARLSAATVSLITFITPVMALTIGVLFNGERLGHGVLAGVVLILLSLGLFLSGGRLRLRSRWRRAS